MASSLRWYACTAVAAPLLVAFAIVPAADAQTQKAKQPSSPPAAASPAQPKPLPPRTPFTAADEAATIPGMPDARFWPDSVSDFNAALPPATGSVARTVERRRRRRFRRRTAERLERSSGKRPDYAVVTGVSTGALMAPFYSLPTRNTMAHCATPTPRYRLRIFSRLAARPKALSIPGR